MQIKYLKIVFELLDQIYRTAMVLKLITSLLLFALRKCMWLKINRKLQDLLKVYQITYMKKLFGDDYSPQTLHSFIHSFHLLKALMYKKKYLHTPHRHLCRASVWIGGDTGPIISRQDRVNPTSASVSCAGTQAFDSQGHCGGVSLLHIKRGKFDWNTCQHKVSTFLRLLKGTYDEIIFTLQSGSVLISFKTCKC